MRSAARISLMTLALVACAVGAVVLANQSATSARTALQGDPEQSCLLASRYKLSGPALTVAQVETASLREMKKVPGTPPVPFGHSNGQWVLLKAQMRSGDELHAFETDTTSGYLLARGQCVVGQMINWIR